MSPRRLLLAAALLLAPAAARAHEPLWGESPQTFAFGIWHPELRFGFENDHLLLRGSRQVANPDALRRSRFESLLSLQYAPKTSLNLKLEVPFVQVTTQQAVGGQLQHSGTNGLGDITISAKSRFYQKFGEDWKVHQAVVFGVQLPTGAHGGRYPDGALLEPSDQPGSGKFGIVVGYAFAWERLNDTTWASVVYTRDLGGAGSKGDMLMADANYGYWAVRALRPQDLGIIIASGAHIEVMGRDQLNSGPDPNSGYTLAGLQASMIATKGLAQFRIGVMVPVHQNVNGVQLRPDIEVRAGFEMLL